MQESLGTDTALARTVKVVVRGLRLAKSGNGVLRAALFLDKRGFPDEPHQAASLASLDLDAWVSRYAQLSQSTLQGSHEVEVELAFTNQTGDTVTSDSTAPEPLRVAVAIFHDANGNGILDTGVFGIPREGFGFSANPQIWKGAPGFQDCLVPVAGARPSIAIDVRYLLGATSRNDPT